MTLLVYKDSGWVDTSQSRARGRVQLCVLFLGTGNAIDQSPEVRLAEGAFLLPYSSDLILEDVRVPAIHNLNYSKPYLRHTLLGTQPCPTVLMLLGQQ